MIYRTLGRTNLRVSEIGFGAWGIGKEEWLGADDDRSRQALKAAFDAGVNFFDTALAYGSGHSERLVGAFAREVGRDKVVLATKIPPKNRQWPAPCGVPIDEVFPKDYIRACATESLQNLGVDTIDLLQLHVWQDEWLEHEGWQRALEDLKREGKIRHVGVSINDHDPTSALLLAQHRIADVVQAIYNIFDPTPADALFDLCQAANVGIIARVPFDEGALTGALGAATTFPAGDFRNLYFGGDRLAEVARRVDKLGALLGPEARTLPELALRFCLAPDAVSTVIVGTRSPEHARANAAVSDGRRLSDPLLVQLSRHAWTKNFYDALH